MNYRLWSYIVGPESCGGVCSHQGDVLAFWLLAAILIAEGLVAYITSKIAGRRARGCQNIWLERWLCRNDRFNDHAGSKTPLVDRAHRNCPERKMLSGFFIDWERVCRVLGVLTARTQPHERDQRWQPGTEDYPPADRHHHLRR